MNFANISSEMKKILVFGVFWAVLGIASVDAAGRDTVTNARTKTVQSAQTRTANVSKVNSNRATAVRKSSINTNTQRSAKGNPATRTATSGGRAGTTAQKTQTRAAVATPGTGRTATNTTTTRTQNYTRAKTARAATDSLSETKTGAAYEQCKSAYFQCMDQFCSLKNEEYRRCSCSDRVMELADVRNNLTETNSKLTEFTENLDIVGMTAAQATALHTASDGENALTADTSASKALLQAIMNSIRGEDSTVSGKMSDLNSINISFDTANAFGITDSAQLVAQYNGSTLYGAVYPNCRNAVRSDCSDAALQRAVTAYLMSIEQDCNTVQTALVNKQKELKAAVREGSAMLDLARIENRKKHNSDDFTACLGNVEAAVLSEQVCGADYHKCLDNGEYIDVTTGAPIAGVVGFANLGKLLQFSNTNSGNDVNATDQRLSLVPENTKFVTNFENKTKKFAKDALDKCSEIADSVWSEYLDKALLAIHYAQQSKVKTIRDGCFDLITACYSDRNAAITTAMKDLIDGTTETSLIPDKITLTQNMCNDYIQSCNELFGDENNTLVEQYVNNQKETDTLAACRAVVQQCFTKYGGANYENFYYPYSGLFQPYTVDTTDDEAGEPLVQTALDWFSLYEYDENGNRINTEDAEGNAIPKYKSPCAKEVAEIASCRVQIEEVFGGFDSIIATRTIDPSYGSITYSSANNDNSDVAHGYGWVRTSSNTNNPNRIDFGLFTNRSTRPVGIATEVYNNIVDNLQNQCLNANGRFVEAQNINVTLKKIESNNTSNNTYHKDYCYYKVPSEYLGVLSESTNSSGTCSEDDNDNCYEYVCPRNYVENIDVNAWGICSCWQNGARRSLNGTSSKCSAYFPYNSDCPAENESVTLPTDFFYDSDSIQNWCPAKIDVITDRVTIPGIPTPDNTPYGLNASQEP